MQGRLKLIFSSSRRVLWRLFVRGNVFKQFSTPQKPALHLGGCCHLKPIHISNFSKLASCS